MKSIKIDKKFALIDKFGYSTYTELILKWLKQLLTKFKFSASGEMTFLYWIN